jgi:hypothetical protein
MSALGWLVDQSAFAPRADHLFHVIASAILANHPGESSWRRYQEGNVTERNERLSAVRRIASSMPGRNDSYAFVPSSLRL